MAILTSRLGTLWKRKKNDNRIYRLRQLPIKNNGNEKRIRYLQNLQDVDDVIYKPATAAWELYEDNNQPHKGTPRETDKTEDSS